MGYEDYSRGFLPDDPDAALEPLEQAFNNHVIPFLADWWQGLRPIPSAEEIAQIQAAVRERAAQHPPCPEYGRLSELLERLAQSLRFNRRNYVNIHPSPYVPSALASFVVSLQNPNNIVQEVSKATWQMEEEAIAWMATHLFGIEADKGPWGSVVSGGTVANMTALMVARDYTYDKLSRPRPGRIGARGVVGQKPGVVLGTAASHYSLEKALWFLGLGSENLVRVPVCYDEAVKAQSYRDERFLEGLSEPWKRRVREAVEKDARLGQEELERFYAGEQSPFGLQPLGSEILKVLYSCFTFDTPLIACVLTLGTTDTGTIERVDNEAIQDLRNEDVFIHLDAASGGFAFLSDQVKPQLIDLDTADSFTVDAHKMGFLHYPCGAVLFRHRGFLEQIRHEAPYLGPLAPTLEGSRPGTSSAALWLAQQTLGPDGYRALVDRLLRFTGELAHAFVKGGEYQVLHRVDLNAMAVAPLPRHGESREEVNRLVRIVRQAVLDGGEFMVNHDRHLSAVKVVNRPGGTSDTDKKLVDIEAIRIVVTNPLVQLEDAGRLVALLEELLKEARAGRGPRDLATLAAANRQTAEPEKPIFSEEP